MANSEVKPLLDEYYGVIRKTDEAIEEAEKRIIRLHSVRGFDTSTMIHLRLTLRPTPDKFLHLPFPYTLTTTPLKCSSCGRFTTSSYMAVVEGPPTSLV